jgi:hypothetical protein
MTISATPAIVVYLGDDVTLTFSVPFEFYDNTDLRVRKYPDPNDDSVYTEYTPGTEYFVTGGNGGTGSIELLGVAAPESGSELEIVLNMPFGQTTQYTPHGVFPAEGHERALDRLSSQIKQLAQFVPGAGGTAGVPGDVDSVFGRTGNILALATDYENFYSDILHTHAYSEITGKPATFPPSPHTHVIADITDWPATFPPDAHTHQESEIVNLDKYSKAEADGRFNIAAYASLSDTAIGLTTIDATWQTLDNYDTLPFTPFNVTNDQVAGTMTFDYAGIYLINVQVNLSHDTNPGGRTTNVRLYNVTDAAPGVAVPVGVARDQAVTNMSVQFMVEIAILDIGKAFAIQLGGGDTLSSVTGSARFEAIMVSELKG